MDFTSILLAGLGGALGAGVGILVGSRLPGRSDRLGVRQGVTIALAVAGALVMPIAAAPLLSGEREASDTRNIGAEIDNMFAENEMFEALATVDPDAQQRMRERAVEAYRSEGAERAEQVIYEEAFVLGQTAVMVYGPQATDAGQ